METKICGKCGEEKEVSEFYKTKCSYERKCKKCRLEDNNIARNKRIESLGLRKSKEILPYGQVRCTRCKEIKHPDDFYFNKFKNRLESWCKECIFEASKEYKSKYYIDNKQNLLDYSKKHYAKNKEKRKSREKERRENDPVKYKEKNKRWNIKIANFSTYSNRLTIDEDPIEGENGELLCRCTYCRNYFPVTNLQAKNRASSINGSGQSTENRMYCNDQCKDLCPIYYRKSFPKGFKKNKQSRCNQERVRQILLDIQFDEEGYNWCEKCGDILSPEELVFHHNIPVGDNPNEYDNASHYMVVCKDKCHTHKGCLGNIDD